MKTIQNTPKVRMAARLRAMSFTLAAGLTAAPLLTLPLSTTAAVNVGVAITLAPPPLPQVVQPVAPAPGYIWTPGYWAWGQNGYYWVDGAWLVPPAIGLLWTPGWWGWSDGYYRWHGGYWGPRVGFYGGINYGFGYFGTGYVGGAWRGRDFYYNQAVTHVNITNVRNVYVDKTVIHNAPPDRRRISYNGGHGGLASRPTAEQRDYARQPHPGGNNPHAERPQRSAAPDRQETHPSRPGSASWQTSPGRNEQPNRLREASRERPQGQAWQAGRPDMGHPQMERPDTNRPDMRRAQMGRPESRPDAGQWRGNREERPRAEAPRREGGGRHEQGGPQREERRR